MTAGIKKHYRHICFQAPPHCKNDKDNGHPVLILWNGIASMNLSNVKVSCIKTGLRLIFGSK